MATDIAADSPMAMAGERSTRQQLERWIGSWKTDGMSYTEGENGANLRASRVKLSMTEVWEWLPGHHFATHRWEGTVGESPFQGLEVIGHDRERGRLVSRFFDNNGNAPVYDVVVQGNTWIYTGSAQRATLTWGDEGNSVMIHWDWLNGGRWVPLCDLKSVRVG
jgi:hypothetical protein